ncbi:MAG TPA: MBL fold metallo-hydrolase, partial [Thermodesulfobacteriota bacterium]|nr:MBL fold metallo-hydrolase [Thermodesulfobacteriota bacterium]
MTNVFLQTPNGRQMLIDGGPNKKVLSELGEVMPFYDRSIDVVVATHPDADHIGGLPEVLERYDVSYIFDPGAISDSSVYRAWENAVNNEESSEYKIISRGTRIFLEDDIWLEVLYPFKNQKSSETNEMSIVAKLIFGKTCFLLTGDLERKGEYELLNDRLECDVLKAGHHGSKTSTSD